MKTGQRGRKFLTRVALRCRHRQDPGSLVFCEASADSGFPPSRHFCLLSWIVSVFLIAFNAEVEAKDIRGELLSARREDGADRTADRDFIILRTATAPGEGKPRVEGTCFAVDTIRLEGFGKLIEAETVRAAAEPLAARCQNNDTVGKLLKAVNSLFADRGFATTQAWLPEQDIAASKSLLVTIVPGRVDRVIYKEDRTPYTWFVPRMAHLSRALVGSGTLGEVVANADAWIEGLDDELEHITLLPASARIAAAKTIREGDILEVDRIQNTLNGLNRVSSNKAKAELVPGRKPATSDVQITNQVNDTFRLYGGYDTQSIEGVDKLRFGITAEKDNLIGINDTWGLTLKSGVDTDELSGNVAVPIGNVTLRLNGDWSENMIDLGPLSELFMTTWAVNAGADWIVHSSKTERLVADFSIGHREQNRYINGFALTDQRVSPLQAGLSYSHFFEQGSITARLGASRGLSIFNAAEDPDDIDRAIPHNQFTKLDASLSGSYVFPGVASVSSSVSSQWSPSALYSDDQMTIGSRSTVRGFSNGSLKADIGAVWRNELAFALPVDWLLGPSTGTKGSVVTPSQPSEWPRMVLSRLNPYVFVDAGLGRDIANGFNGYRVSSGLGLRYGGPRLSFDVGYAWRLDEDGRSQRARDETGELYMSLRLKVL